MGPNNKKKIISYPVSGCDHITVEHTKDNVDSNLTLSWSYYQGSGDIFQTSGNVEPDYRYAENNKHFTQLANIIHEQELTEEMENRVSRHRMKKQEEYQSVEVNCNSNNDDCKSDEWIFEIQGL